VARDLGMYEVSKV